MARFTTRVELHGAEESDYDVLHTEMENRDFKRTISGDNKEYKLPNAEYNIEIEADISAVLKLAQEAAKVVKLKGKLMKDASILVTKSDGRTWSGLEPA
ncbi:MAG: hypothetical protein K2X47_09780 [Bdellovibrionales bacterium]|nr:hypothetical protein [Bdellovibrionales bacterium]